MPIRVRADSKWNVPEPELTLVINAAGEIVGYTVGNDVSSRDIEGENPLYLPQAKVYDGSCAVGPGIMLLDDDAKKLQNLSVVLEIDARRAHRVQGRHEHGADKAPAGRAGRIPAPRAVRSRRARSCSPAPASFRRRSFRCPRATSSASPSAS